MFIIKEILKNVSLFSLFSINIRLIKGHNVFRKISVLKGLVSKFYWQDQLF